MGILRETDGDSSDSGDGSRDPPRRRVVLLGASNLTRGISTVVETSQRLWGTPLDVMAAAGHGRSYGMTSRVLGRSLPAIVACDLWEDLARRAPLPTAALITDIGNDILYGAEASQIAAWVEQCLVTLKSACEKTVITGLPLPSIASLSPKRFLLFRTLLFPRSQLTLDVGLSRAEELNSRLAELAAKYQCVFFVPSIHWYGWDPIHIRLKHWPRAWNEILSSWCERDDTTLAHGSFLRWLKLRTRRPSFQKMFGIEQRRAQPSCALRDGTTISLY